MTLGRYFFAIDLDDEARIKLHAEVEGVKAQFPGEIKWVKPDNYHILCFF